MSFLVIARSAGKEVAAGVEVREVGDGDGDGEGASESERGGVSARGQPTAARTGDVRGSERSAELALRRTHQRAVLRFSWTINHNQSEDR